MFKRCISDGKKGTKYAYESESFRDPVTHKPKSQNVNISVVWTLKQG